MNLLTWYVEGSLDLWAFQDSAQVCVCHHIHEEVSITLEESHSVRNARNFSNFWKALSKCRTPHMPTSRKFHNVWFAHIKQSNTRDASEDFDDTTAFTVDDARSPALAMTSVSPLLLPALIHRETWT